MSVLLIILFPLLFGTEPSLPPYHQYRVSGVIERQSGGPKENYVVSLACAFSDQQPDTVIDITSRRWEDDIEKCVTDTSGYFFLEARSDGKADKQTFIFPTWFIPTGGIALLEERRIEEPGRAGCGTTEVTSEPFVKGYLYTFQNQKVVIPD